MMMMMMMMDEGKSLLFFSVIRPKSGGTVPPLHKVGDTRTPRTAGKLRLWNLGSMNADLVEF